MVELRWVLTQTAEMAGQKLQYRFITPNVDASGAMCAPGVWSAWSDVPTVIESDLSDNANNTEEQS